jgi:hypothetical protein
MIMAEPSLSIELQPKPVYNQVWAYETYLANLTLHDLNISNIDLTGYTGAPSEILFNGSIIWSGKGGYHFGSKSTGYSYPPIKINMNLLSPIYINSVFFNITLENDAWNYGVKPYESVDVSLRFNVYILMSDGSNGPKIITKTSTWSLVDDTKVDYFEGKFSEMQGEIITVTEAAGITTLNRAKYLNLLNTMNASLTQGNYVEAQKIWKDYDDKERANMILALVHASDLQSEELDRLATIENELILAQRENTRLVEEYDFLETTYTALFNTYHKVNAELNSAKRNLSTAITAVFLTAILFYFLGRRGIGRREEE